MLQEKQCAGDSIQVHTFERYGKRLSIDARSLGVFELDEVASAVLPLYGKMSAEQIVSRFTGRYPGGRVREAYEDLNALEREGVLTRGSESESHNEPFESHIEALALYVTTACNLRCSYCFVDHTSPSHMSLDTAKKAADYLVDQTNGNRCWLGFFGGEPLLRFDFIQAVIAYADRKTQSVGKTVSYHLTTNATWMSKDVAHFLKDHDVRVLFSVDGDQRTHDSVRKFGNGQGSFERAMRNIQYYRRITGEDPRIQSTLTRKNPHTFTIFRSLEDLGFRRVGIYPAITDVPEVRLDEEAWDVVFEEYAMLMDHYSTHFEAYKDILMPQIVSSLRGLFTDEIRHWRCGAGRSYYSVAPDGTLYPCDTVMGLDEFRCGSVFDGIDVERVQRTLPGPVDHRPICGTCWCRYICGGGCIHEIHTFGKAYEYPCGPLCKLLKLVLEYHIYIAYTFYEDIAPAVTRERVDATEAFSAPGR